MCLGAGIETGMLGRRDPEGGCFDTPPPGGRAGVGDNLPSAYGLSGLVAAAKSQAEAARKVKLEREKEDTSKQSTPKSCGLINGGKT